MGQKNHRTLLTKHKDEVGQVCDMFVRLFKINYVEDSFVEALSVWLHKH